MRKRIFFFLIIMLCQLVGNMPGVLAESLRIYGKGGAGDWENPAFHEMYPSITIEYSENLGVINASDLTTVLLTREAYDIYAISFSNSNFTSVIDKGYALDLSQESKLNERLEKTYKFLYEPLSRPSAIYGIPISITCSQWGISYNVWNTVNEEIRFDIPSNYDELLNFIEWWIEEGQYEYTNVRLLKNSEDVKRDIIDLLVKHLLDIAWKEKNGNILQFQDVENLFQRIDSIDFGKLSKTVIDDSGEYNEYIFDIAFNWFEIEEYESDRSFSPLLLNISENIDLAIPIDMRIMFVNPATHSRKAAIDYLLCYLECRDDVYNILIYDEKHDPVENPYIRNQIKLAEDELKKIQASDDTQFTYEADQLINKINKLENMKWLVTYDKICQYQSISQILFVREYNPVYMNDPDGASGINKIIESFSQEKLSCHQLCSELYRMFRYAFLENL